MSNRTFDKRYRGDHPMFDYNDYCDKCGEPVADGELDQDLKCYECRERERDSAEFYSENDR